MIRLVPDADQPWDHEGNPEDGPPRFVRRETSASYVSPQLTTWIERKKRERLATEKLTRVRLRANREKSVPCCECHEPVISVYKREPPVLCVLCEVIQAERDQFQMQLADIHP